MKRSIRIALVALPLIALAAATTYADVKTRDRTTVKFEGMMGRMFNLFGGGKPAEGTTAVKGTRKATLREATGQIVDLSEEKVYDLDMKKKTYTVTTFDELRRKMREKQEEAKKQAEKAEKEEGKPQEAQKPTKEIEIDFDVKDTGQKKQIAGYDAHETIVTITVREKGMTLEESGGLVLTNDIWLGPKIPQLKEISDFDAKYWKALQGPESVAMSAEQMAALVAMFPLFTKASERMQKEGDKLSGTPLDMTMTAESVKSKDQLTEAQASSSSNKGGGGIGGMLAKKIMKQEPPKARSTIVTTHHEVLEVSTSVTAADLAIPADFKEKK
jgi:hypothetical protein